MPNRILVLKPSSLGDIVHTLPAVAMLRARWPQACIQWLVNSEWLPILTDNPHIDHTIEFPRRAFRGMTGAFSFLQWLQQNRKRLAADLVLDYQGLLRTAIIGKVAKSSRLLGLSDAREGSRWFYSAMADTAGEQHSVERYLALSELATGLSRPPVLQFPLPEGLPVRDIPLPTRFFILHPFSRGVGKSMDVESALSLAALIAKKAPVLLVGRDAPPLPNSLPTHVHSLIDQTTLPELLWLMRQAIGVVSVDSGPMHIAAAVAPVVLGIHAWSDPAQVGPYHPTALVWQNGAIKRMCDILASHSPHPGKLPTRDELGLIADAIIASI